MNILCREVQSNLFTIRAWLDNYPKNPHRDEYGTEKSFVQFSSSCVLRSFLLSTFSAWRAYRSPDQALLPAHRHRDHKC
jgi:hypothetical protein